MPNSTRVFISYSHDSEQPTQFVLELAGRLIEDGFNCVLDFYLEETPVEGWRAWLETEVAKADFVLVISTPSYLQRYQHNQVIETTDEAAKGLVISQELYHVFAKQTKFIPILPEGGKLQDIIPPLQGQNAFELMADYLGLHQLLKNRQPKLTKVEPQTPQWQQHSQESNSSKAVAQTEKVTSTDPVTSKQTTYLTLIVIIMLMIGLAFLMLA